MEFSLPIISPVNTLNATNKNSNNQIYIPAFNFSTDGGMIFE